MKNALYPEWVLVLWAARRLKRPVQWIGERNEEFLASVHGRDSCMRARLALDKDGKFLALEAHVLAFMGAYIDRGAGVDHGDGQRDGRRLRHPACRLRDGRRIHPHRPRRRLSRRRHAGEHLPR